MTEFNLFGFKDAPDFILCNPNKEELFYLGQITERTYSPRFNSPSEISFRADQYIDGVKVPYYDFLTFKRLVYLKDVAYFMITGLVESGDGIEKYKEVNAQSLEVEFSQKNLSMYKTTNIDNIPAPVLLWSVIPSTPNLLGDILLYMPDWSIGVVDTDNGLDPKYRFFNVTDTTIYNFLVDEVEKAYECVFVFDTIAKTISAYSPNKVTAETNIFLSYDNLIESMKKEEVTDELTTSLNVLGGGGLDIRRVNPIGTNNIYKFDYFTALNRDGTSPWMDITLRNKIVAWEALVSGSAASYRSIVDTLSNHQDTLATQNAIVDGLKIDLAAAEVTLQGKIEAGEGREDTTVTPHIHPTQAYVDAKNAVNTLTASLAQAESAVESTMLDIEEVISILSVKNTALSFNTNFTPEEIKNLQPFIIEASYINENYALLDSMSGSTIQEEQILLLEQATRVLEETSQPRYTFEVNSVNFTEIEEFASFTGELKLGNIITIEVDEGVFARAVLLGIDYDLEDPSNFKLIFGNRMRLDNASFKFSDLMGEALSGSKTTKVNSIKWGNFEENYKSDVTQFMESSLNAARNNIISSDNQEFVISKAGIRGTKTTNGVLDGNQIWMSNNMLAFTDDSWATAKMALGHFIDKSVTPEKDYGWGLVADTIVGKLIAGNNLVITNSNSSFTVSGSQMSANNMVLSLANNTNSISINPAVGIEIKNNVGTKVFSIGTDGNIDISYSAITDPPVIPAPTWNSLTGKPAYVSDGATAGLHIGSTYLGYHNGTTWKTYMDANGKFYLSGPGTNQLSWDGTNLSLTGAITATSGTFSGAVYASSGTFTGAVNASTLTGYIDWNYITNYVPNGNVTNGYGANRVGWGVANTVTTDTSLFYRIQAGDFTQAAVLNGRVIINGNLDVYNAYIFEQGVRVSTTGHLHDNRYSLIHSHPYAASSHTHPYTDITGGVSPYVYVVSSSGVARRLNFEHGILIGNDPA